MINSHFFFFSIDEQVEGLISSPLQQRWTSEVFQRNVNKVRSILVSVDACMEHWMFASMLSKLGRVEHALYNNSDHFLLVFFRDELIEIH